MYLIIFLLISGLSAVHGSQCEDLSGVWVNELGSNMTIVNLPLNKITGEYSTAVESTPGAASITSNLTGAFLPLDDGSLLAFTVLFNRGSSLTSWVGQCLVCDGKEVIFTTWVLQRTVKRLKDKWMDTLVRQNTFTRRVTGTDGQSEHRVSTNTTQSSVPSNTTEDIIKGTWTSGSGDILNIANTFRNRTATGSYNDFEIIGRYDGIGNFTALGFVSPISAQKFKAGIGHVYTSDARRLVTSWLEHEFTNNCIKPRNRVFLGFDDYIRSDS